MLHKCLSGGNRLDRLTAAIFQMITRMVTGKTNMKRVVLGVVLVLVVGCVTVALGQDITCMELANLIKQELKQPDKLTQTYSAYGAGECTNINGEWWCFRCQDQGKDQFVQVQNPKTAAARFVGYGCNCRKR